MEARGRRDEMVIATKFTGSQTMHLGDKVIQSNFGGNNAKNIYTSIERSLTSLRTSYIDLVSPFSPHSLAPLTPASITSTSGTTPPPSRSSCTPSTTL